MQHSCSRRFFRAQPGPAFNCQDAHIESIHKFIDVERCADLADRSERPASPVPEAGCPSLLADDQHSP